MLARHVDLVILGGCPYCRCSLLSVSCQVSRRPHAVGGFQRSAYSILIFVRPRSRETPSNAASGLTTSNNVISRSEQSAKWSGTAIIKDPTWANHTTAATCNSTSVDCSIANTLAGPRRFICPPRSRSRPPPTPPLFSAHLISKYFAKRKVCRASARSKDCLNSGLILQLTFKN